MILRRFIAYIHALRTEHSFIIQSLSGVKETKKKQGLWEIMPNKMTLSIGLEENLWGAMQVS